MALTGCATCPNCQAVVGNTKNVCMRNAALGLEVRAVKTWDIDEFCNVANVVYTLADGGGAVSVGYLEAECIPQVAIARGGAGGSSGSQEVTRKAFYSSVAVVRPNNVTAYTANDVVGVTGASALITFPIAGGVAGESYQLQSFDVLIPSTGSVPAGMTTFALFIYDSVATAIADNAPMSIAPADYASYQGRIITSSAANFGNTIVVSGSSVNLRQVTLASANLYGYLVATGGYTPQAVSEAYQVALGGTQF